MKYFFYVLTSLAWPAAFVWIVCQYKEEIRGLLNRIAQPGFFTASFKTTLPLSTETAVADLSLDAARTTLDKIAAKSPKIAIINAWQLLITTAIHAGYPLTPTTPPHDCVVILADRAQLPDGVIFILNQLLATRLRIEHAVNFNPGSIEALGFIDMTIAVADVIAMQNNPHSL